MIIKCYGERHRFLLFIDIEFSKDDLVQFAGLLFKWIDDETYQLMRSINVYITQKVCYPFMEYTNISNSFLEENGIPLSDANALIKEDFLKDVSLSDLLIVSHGLKNDRMVLNRNGLNLSSYNGKPIDGYCTFTNAKRILERQRQLKLADIAEECGFYLHNAHNAYQDVQAEVAIFTFLKKIEIQNKMQQQQQAPSSLQEDKNNEIS